MNASEFNTKLNKVIDEAVNEGMAKGKMSFETAIGIIEVHQQGLMDMRKHVAMQQAIAQQPKIHLGK